MLAIMRSLATLSVVLLAASASAKAPRATVIESITTQTVVNCRTLVASTTLGGPVPTNFVYTSKRAIRDIVYISTHRPIRRITPAPTTTLAWNTTTTTFYETAPQNTDTVSTTSTLYSTSTTTTTVTETETDTASTVTSTIVSTSTVPTPANWTPAATPTPTPDRLRKRTKPKPKSSPPKRPGVLTIKPGQSKAQLFPQAVNCTRVAWTIPVQTFVFQGKPRRRTMPVSTVTATATLLLSTTSTILPTDASTTLSYSTTVTATETDAATTTTTTWTTATATAISTVTAYAACATGYTLGPFTPDDQEAIVGVEYANGVTASFVNGSTPLDCCNACWSSAGCAGSAFFGYGDMCINLVSTMANVTNQTNHMAYLASNSTNQTSQAPVYLANGPVGYIDGNML